MKRIKLYIFVLIITYSSIYSAEIPYGAGTKAGSFLRIDTSARVSGMAGAFTSITGDVSCLNYNPAGLVTIEYPQVYTTYGNWFVDTNFGYIAFALPSRTKNNSTIALSLTYLDYGNLTRVTGLDENGIPVEAGTFNASDMNLSAGYARKQFLMNREVMLGVALKFVHLAIDNNSAFGFGIDMGANYMLDKDWCLGVAVKNIGTSGKMINTADDLPTEIRVGSSREFVVKEQNIKCSIDIIEPLDNKLHLLLGIESKLIYDISARAGYRVNYDTDWFTVGFGYNYKNIRLDYAYVPFNVLGNTHRISLRYFFTDLFKEVTPPHTVAPLPPPKISDIVAVFNGIPKSTFSIEWQWQDVEGADGYRIYDAENDKLLQEVLQGKSVWLETGLQHHTKYTRYIKAFNITEEGKSSVKTSATTHELKSVLFVKLLNKVALEINFKHGEYTIQENVIPVLDKIAELLIEFKPNKVYLEGHTDNSGEATENLDLSQRRSDTVKQYLIKKGVPDKILVSIGYGDKKPIADNNTEESKKKNRRVEFVIITDEGKEVRATRE